MTTSVCFFLQTEKPISGTQIVLLHLASYIAEYTNIETYFVNQNNSCFPFKPSENLKVFSVEEFDFSKCKNSTFITTINYMFYLLTKIESFPTAKLFCLFNFPQAYDALLSQLKNTSIDKVSLLNLFIQNSSYAFVNHKCITFLQKYNVTDFSKRILTETVGELDNTIGQPSQLVKNKISIAWYGSLNDDTLYPFQSLLNNLKRSFPDKKIDMHIIGDGKLKWKTDFSKYSPIIRFFFTPFYQNEHDTFYYLIKNVDLVVTYGVSALKSASLELPTIITPFNRKSYRDDRYVFLFDTNGGILNWTVDELWNFNFTIHTLADIVNDLYKYEKKEAYGKACANFSKKYYSLSENGNKLLNWLNSSSLTVEKCLQNSLVKMQLTCYHEYLARKSIQDYSEYHKIIAEEKKKGTLKGNDKVRFYLKENYVSFKNKIKARFPQLLSLKQRIIDINLFLLQYGYYKKIKNIRIKLQSTGKIKVGFILVFNSVFPTMPVFEEMLDSQYFDPYIIVVPNTSRSHQYQMDIFHEATTALEQQYPGRIIYGYEEKTDSYYDLKDEYSIIFFCNPYPNLVHKLHYLDYFLDKNVLTVYMNYGFAALSFWNEVIHSDFYNKVWLACVESPMNLSYLKKHSRIFGINGVVTGYLKMDKLATIMPTPRLRKRIIISPHHTVWGWKTLNISNFLKYYNFFLELPRIYPDIDFVFRPHPLLFPNLLAHNIWTNEQINNYLIQLESNPNAIYDHSGDYMEQFANSDAMIHDCGSFIGEYLYTEKPCCYMLKSEKQTQDGLLPLGQACIDNYYKAFSQDDILKFIDNVVIKGKDPLKEKRFFFVQSELKQHYPNSAQKLIEMLEKKLL